MSMNRIIADVDKAITSSAKVDFDEKTDKVQENPDSGPEKPDEKTSSKKDKKAKSGSNEDSSMINYEIDQTKQKKAAPVKNKKGNMPNLPTEDINFGTKSSIAKLEEAWNLNKNRIENINQTKLEEDSFVESGKKSKASDDPEEVVSESIEMSKASIKSIVKHANGLIMGLNETNQNCLSEGWVASKITIIEDYLRTIHDYVMYYEEDDSSEETD
jgi:hypothetical protein